MSLKERLVKDTLQYTVANYVAMAIGILVSISTKAILGPLGSGYWAMLKVFSSYGEYSDLGTRNAMIREIPRSGGAGDTEKCRKIQDNALSFTLAASVISAAAILGIAGWVVRDPVLKKGLYLTAFLVIVTQVYNFALMLLRTSKRVGTLSFVIIFNIALVGVFSVLGALWKGILGMTAGVLVATVLSAFYSVWRGGLRLGWEWDRPEIGRLLGIGFPMVVVSYALVTFLSIDSLMIGKMIGYEALGLYAIGLMSVQQISTLGRFSQIILMPHIQEKYGRTGLLTETTPYFVRTTNALVSVLPVLIGAVYFLVPVVVHYFLVRFEGGIPAMKILVLGYFFVAANEMSISALYTADKQKQLIPILVTILLIGAGLNYLFIRAGWGIEGVALATGISYFLFFVSIFSYAFGGFLKRTEVIKMVGKVMGLFAYMTAAAFLTDRFLRLGSAAAEGLARYAVFSLSFLPVLVRLEKEERLFGILVRLIGSRQAQRPAS